MLINLLLTDWVFTRFGSLSQCLEIGCSRTWISDPWRRI